LESVGGTATGEFTISGQEETQLVLMPVARIRLGDCDAAADSTSPIPPNADPDFQDGPFPFITLYSSLQDQFFI
jgi:hypothetical protein